VNFPSQPETSRDRASLGAEIHYTGPERRCRVTVLVASSRIALGTSFSPLINEYRSVDISNALVTTAQRLFDTLERRRPRILLLDSELLDTLSPRAAQSITETFPALRVLLICDRERADLVDAILRNRFHGFLKTSDSPQLCVKAFAKVSRGELWIPRPLLEEALLSMPRGPRRAGLDDSIARKLSKREAQAVRLLCTGLTNRQIAAELEIREDTVKKHLHKAYGKLGVDNRTQLIAAVSGSAS